MAINNIIIVMISNNSLKSDTPAEVKHAPKCA